MQKFLYVPKNCSLNFATKQPEYPTGTIGDKKTPIRYLLSYKIKKKLKNKIRKMNVRITNNCPKKITCEKSQKQCKPKKSTNYNGKRASWISKKTTLKKTPVREIKTRVFYFVSHTPHSWVPCNNCHPIPLYTKQLSQISKKNRKLKKIN